MAANTNTNIHKLEELLNQHIQSSAEYRDKVTKMEQAQLLVLQSLSDGKENFKMLFQGLTEIKERIAGIAANCKTHNDNVEHGQDEIKKLDARVVVFEDIQKQAKGILWAFKLIGWGGVVLIFMTIIRLGLKFLGVI